ncbi:hypothetical protein [Jiangella endophytica]|uniref:hypothetical protein n=1 Tax=Jiangella endophytica TaxID=1623398 RepID=UPI000E3529D6|nr:hypothetical protein [Jiangella endophytica]
MSEHLRTEWYARSRLVYASLGVVGVVATITMMTMGGALRGDDGPPEPDGMDEHAARYVCEGFVRGRLDAPDTADFQRPDVTPLGDGRWRVEGTVASENGLGALLRSSYSCLVRDDGDGEAHLMDLELTD